MGKFLGTTCLRGVSRHIPAALIALHLETLPSCLGLPPPLLRLLLLLLPLLSQLLLLSLPPLLLPASPPPLPGAQLLLALLRAPLLPWPVAEVLDEDGRDGDLTPGRLPSEPAEQAEASGGGAGWALGRAGWVLGGTALARRGWVRPTWR